MYETYYDEENNRSIPEQVKEREADLLDSGIKFLILIK